MDIAAVLLDSGQTLLIEAAFLSGDYAAATVQLEAAQQAADAAGDKSLLAGAIDQLGFLEHWRNLDSTTPDADRELHLFEQALALRREIGDDVAIAESLFHVGLVHQIFKDDWETANSYFMQADDHAIGADDLLISEIERHLGAYLWLHKHEGDAALVRLRRSLELRSRLDFQAWLATGLIALGQCELDNDQLAAGIEHLRQGIAVAEEIGVRPRWIDGARRKLQVTLAD